MRMKIIYMLLAVCGFTAAMDAQVPCCDFSNDLAQGWQVNFPDPSNPCLVEVCAPQFFDDQCIDQITTSDLDWGDGTPVLQVFTDLQQCYTHEYQTAGTYTIGATIVRREVTGAVCGQGEMTTTVAVSCNANVCCADEAGFMAKIAEGWTVELVDGCRVILCAPQFVEGGCYYLATSDLDWGDGSPVFPVLTPFAGCYEHTYNGSGSFVVRGNICEVNADGSVCWCAPMEITISVQCTPPPVECCKDQDAFLDKIALGWQVIEDGCNVILCAPQFDSSCHVLTWSAPDWGDGTPNLPAITPIEDCYTHTYESSGFYEIKATVCEIDSTGCICWCEQMNTVVEVDCGPPPGECCADTLAFFERVSQGFFFFQDGCCITVSPFALENCDVVTEWCFDGICIPVTGAGNDFTYCYQQSGEHEICMKVALIDPATGEICADTMVCETIFVECDPGTCTCGPWNLTYSVVEPGAPGQSAPVSCGDTIGVSCGKSFCIQGTLGCNPQGDPFCMGYPIWWEIIDPTNPYISLHGQFFSPVVNLCIKDGLLPHPGLYILNIYGRCGNDKCQCTIYINVPKCDDLCCQNPDDFFKRVNEGFDWEANGCCIVTKPSALNDCDVVLEWCFDGVCVPATGGPGVGQWCFNESGPHEVCMKAAMLDENGNICAEATFCDTIEVNCNQGCTCGPWKIDGTLFDYEQPTLITILPDLNCGDTITFSCNYDKLALSGTLQCIPGPAVDCKFPAFGFANLYDPEGNVVVTILLSGSSFGLSLSPAWFNSPGTYKLVIGGKCGDEFCYCTLYIERPKCKEICCEDLEAFYKRVEEGFEWEANGCCITVEPAGLNDCDVLTEWCFDGTCVPASAASGAMTWCFDQSGPHEVCMKVVMLDENGNICAEATFCDTIELNCKGCPCGPWNVTGVLFDNEQPSIALDFEAPCGDTIEFGCNWDKLVLSGCMSCLPTATGLCKAKVLYYEIVDPTGLGILVPLAPGACFNISFSSALFNIPGIYQLNIVGDCGGQICRCKYYIVRPKCEELCCGNPDAFFERVEKGFKWEQSNCCITLSPAALSQCDVVTEWCIDGICIPGPFDPDDGFTWCFNESGVHEVCMKAAMIDANGNICAEATFCDTIVVDCKQGCPCGPWDLVGVLNTDDPDQALDFEVECRDTILFDCQWKTLTIKGTFTCEQTPLIACLPALKYFQLEDPLGNVVIIGSLMGSTFNFTFNAATFSMPGIYRLTIVGDCAGQKCVCTIYIERPDCAGGCCTDEQGFLDRVNGGFSFSTDSCCVSVKPNKLGPCDFVNQWCWGDGNCSVGPFPGDASVSHCYQMPGVYEVCMYVMEVDTVTGDACWEAAYCDTVVVECPTMQCSCNWDLTIPIAGVLLTPDCGDTLMLECPLVDFDVTGFFSCSTTNPNCQPVGEVSWVLDRPDTLSDLSGFSGVPNLSIPISKGDIAVPGLYALTLTGVCGTDTCSCTIYFMHDCPLFSSEDPGWIRLIQIVPNPASSDVYLLLPPEAQGIWKNWSVTLFNAHGQTLQQRSLRDGKPTQTFDVHALAAGTYHFVARDASGVVRWSGQFVKVSE